MKIRSQIVTWTISSSSDATFGTFSFEKIRMFALDDLRISVMIEPPLPIRHPIRDVDTNKRVVYDGSPDSASIFSLHFGCKRTAASIVGETGSSKNCITTKIRINQDL
jgi:hypothetical protein